MIELVMVATNLESNGSNALYVTTFDCVWSARIAPLPSLALSLSLKWLYAMIRFFVDGSTLSHSLIAVIPNTLTKWSSLLVNTPGAFLSNSNTDTSFASNNLSTLALNVSNSFGEFLSLSVNEANTGHLFALGVAIGCSKNKNLNHISLLPLNESSRL